jgi:NAD(P)-dependent dehydrogenase (short-subunit alcohol dehydrogenase family)
VAERWALVTAGTSGLGAALVQSLADDGFRVLVHYRSSEARFREMAAARPGLEGIAADLAESEGRVKLCEAVRERTDRLHVLVNNLGVYPEEMIEDIDDALFDTILRTTCTAGFDLVRRLRPALEAAAPARVINIGDSGADRIEARRQATPYHIAKLGVHVLTRTWAQVLGPHGVTVNMVSPGFLENSVGEPGEPVPAGRLGRFDDITSAVRFLVSPQAAYTSGTNLLVNGAWNLG